MHRNCANQKYLNSRFFTIAVFCLFILRYNNKIKAFGGLDGTLQVLERERNFGNDGE